MSHLPEVSDASYCVECGCNETLHVDGMVTPFDEWDEGDPLVTPLPVPWCAKCDRWCRGEYDGDAPLTPTGPAPMGGKVMRRETRETDYDY